MLQEVAMYSYTLLCREGGKCLSQTERKTRWRRFFWGEFKPNISTRDPFERERETRNETAWHQSQRIHETQTTHWANDAGMPLKT